VNLSPVSDSDHLSWDDNVEDESLESLEEGDDNEGSSSDASNQSLPDSEAEQPYELQSRMAPDSREIKGPERLPIKLADGQIRKRGNLPLPPSSEAEDEPEDEDSEAERQRAEEARTLARANRTEDVATGARFGRAAVRDIVGTSSRKERIQAAKEQLADICQEIITDPENSVRTFLLSYPQVIYNT
jgi:nucleolar complex protein 3